MCHTYRIGCNIQFNDPYWVQVNEAIYQSAQQLSLNLISIERDLSHLSHDDLIAVAEELLSLELDVLIGWNLPDGLIVRLLDNGLPIVHLNTRHIQHPLFVSPDELYGIGEMLVGYLAEQLGGRGTVLMVGGMADYIEEGFYRIDSFREAMAHYPEMRLKHIPCYWRYEQAYPQIVNALSSINEPIDAIYGLSDSLALAGRNAAEQLGLLSDRAPVVGINGDSFALAAIAQGRMSATVDIFIAEHGRSIVEMAYKAACGEPLPTHFPREQRLVTAQNVADIALWKLTAIADIPNRLVGVNMQQEHQRRIQLETSLAINRQVGAILDRGELSLTLADLIRTNYGYDHVQFFIWQEAEQALVLERGQESQRISVAEAHVLAHAIEHNELVFIPDTRRSSRFGPDPRWPETRSRVVLPMRLGTTIIGLLDLHNDRVIYHSQAELIGLQVLADQVAIAIRNAELYSEALASRAAAEMADQLKTRLLANVSHELRTPLNVILGYSQAALSSPTTAEYDLSPGMRRDLQHIYNSGEHLRRIINDLLDMSRADIDELDLFPETIEPHAFLRETFYSFTKSAGTKTDLTWRLELPTELPLLQADPVRLRQVLLNLLSNANKFTEQGEVVLGAELTPPYAHIWVRDTGVGIAPQQLERIFEPFVTEGHVGQRDKGIGLGLCISRRLMLLHRGSITVESTPHEGSVFHVYLPLPNLAGQLTSTSPTSKEASLLLISEEQHVPVAVMELCRAQNLVVQRVRSITDIDTLPINAPIAAIAWDVTGAIPHQWLVVERLRAHQQFCRLPFMLFGARQKDMRVATSELTGILMKPVSGKTLTETIHVLRPRDEFGSILIVDDEPHARDLYQDLVRNALPEYTVYTAEGGQAALDMLDTITPSMVMLDLTMPEVDGFMVLAEIRARPATHHLPVLIVSSRALSLDDIKQLDFARVTLHTKDILGQDEATSLVQRTLHSSSVLPQHTSTLVKRAVAYLQQHYAKPLSRQEIADAIGVSKNYLSEIFHQELGISPWEYLNRYRMQKAKDLLRTTNKSITTIAAQVGFDDSSYFGRVFHKHVGLTPSQYRQ
jgi:signal transduction histidine kinase/AraC-like DNA-binding protein/DNA-binding LacI/PurR family transcriptional regulator